MPEVSAPSNLSPQETAPFAPLLAPISPVLVIGRWWREMGLHWAYGVHLYGLMLAWIGLEIVHSTSSPYRTPITGELLRELQYAGNDWPLVLGGLIVFVLAIEFGFILLAWLLMPLGASPEPWGRSMGRGLVRVYQLTPFHAVSLVVFVFTVQWIDGSYRTLGFDLQTVLFALSWLVYAWSQVVVTGWAMITHYDRPTWAASCPWPAECEGCGYPLMGVRELSACPECGLDTQVSLKSRRNAPDRRGMLTQMLLAIFSPHAFGRRTTLRRPVKRHLVALAVGSGLMLLAVLAGFFLIAVVLSIREGEWLVGLEDLMRDWDEVLFGISLAWTISCVGVLALSLLCTGVHGLLARLIHKRNILYPAAQALAYQLGYFAGATALGYPIAVLAIVIYEDYSFRRYYYGGYAPPPWIDLLPFTIPAYGLMVLIGYFLLQWRFLRGCRFGNG
ncbi:MAG: hypothetical protein AAGH88_05250 [Planctomycetota bacterium]